MRLRFLFPALVLLAAAPLRASLITLSANGGTVPDNSAVGATFTMNIVSNEIIELAGNGNVVLTLTGVSHTWVGDLSFVLSHTATSTSAVVFDRPGYPALSSGSKGNLMGSYQFGSAYASSFDEAAMASASNTDIPSGNYRPDGNFDVFNGQAAGGIWTLHATDIASGDYMNITWSWSLEIRTRDVVDTATTPEPRTAAIVAALTALGLWRRHSRRR